MATPFQLHGINSTDSGLYPWVIGSITRSLFFYGEATASRATVAPRQSLLITPYSISGCSLCSDAPTISPKTRGTASMRGWTTALLTRTRRSATRI